MRILVVDNYDSFVFNLVQYLGQLGIEAEVWRNDDHRLSDEAAVAGQFDGVLLSPGPGTPERAGASVSIVHGVCGSTHPFAGGLPWATKPSALRSAPPWTVRPSYCTARPAAYSTPMSVCYKGFRIPSRPLDTIR
ncbi:para-aminobenzoate synthase component II [Mycobacterium tuberculosis RGTB327]|nr:para-aminobenzoate synthase component II [Mycobacterium tuberculosis RGTB327]